MTRFTGPVAALLLIGAAQATAQTAALPADRVGPNRAAPALPPYPTEAAPPAALPPASTPTLPAPSGGMMIADVYVGGNAGAYPPRPTGRWAPAPPGPDGLHLVHEDGAALDRAWVRQQFAANDLIGRQVGYDRIAALVQLINLAYLSNGYVNSGVIVLGQSPEAGDGLLRLKLVSGRLVAPAGETSPIAVAWKDGKARGLTAAFVRHRMTAANADPISVVGIEHDFRLLADDPAIRTINADLRPGQRQGEASLLLTVDPAPRYDLYGGVANSRSPSVGGVRASAGGSIRNVLDAGDVVSAEFGSTEGLTDFAAAYATDPLTHGVSMQLRGGFDNAAVIDRPLIPLDIKSREWSIEGGISKALVARPLSPLDGAGHWQAAQSLVIGVLIAHHHLTSTLLGEPFAFSPGSDRGITDYTALRFTADYTRRSIASVLAVSLTGSVGLGGTRPADRSVPQPSPTFVSALAQVNYARRLTAYQTELRLRIAGQGSGGLLYSSERFSLGGADTVRGYRENLLLADEALVGSIELAQPVNLSGRTAGGDAAWTRFTLSAFADAGLAHNRVAPQPLPDNVESVGASLVWAPTAWLYARATYARALNHVDAPGRRDLQDRGFEFKLVFHPLPLIGRIIARPT